MEKFWEEENLCFSTPESTLDVKDRQYCNTTFFASSFLKVLYDGGVLEETKFLNFLLCDFWVILYIFAHYVLMFFICNGSIVLYYLNLMRPQIIKSLFYGLLNISQLNPSFCFIIEAKFWLRFKKIDGYKKFRIFSEFSSYFPFKNFETFTQASSFLQNTLINATYSPTVLIPALLGRNPNVFWKNPPPLGMIGRIPDNLHTLSWNFNSNLQSYWS